MPDFTTLRYLLYGNRRQQRAYATLQALNLWPALAEFSPLLAGTIPLAIDIPGSDLDVLCEVPPADAARFCQLLQMRYGRRPGFHLARQLIGDKPSVVCSFRYRNREIEIFGQDVPTRQQNGFRHLLVEHAVLQAGGEQWRRAVRVLKRQGLKTEPAFAHLLQLPGNPYEALLTLEEKSAAEISAHLARCPLPHRAS